MGRGALRAVNKVVQACRGCGAKGPKELVEGPRRFSAFTFALLLLCTAGLGLLWVPWWMPRGAEAYCERCGQSYPLDY